MTLDDTLDVPLLRIERTDPHTSTYKSQTVKGEWESPHMSHSIIPWYNLSHDSLMDEDTPSGRSLYKPKDTRRLGQHSASSNNASSRQMKEEQAPRSTLMKPSKCAEIPLLEAR